ncbi:hypothetical protein EYC84_004573 [Monilinia fructicola]|uniref:Uncharacterized protein n=1 Tax=Monilinia fructicola TaxID=38448 RepID=A0A5M9K5H3_MONFR|nr:hypothetical protein EYC84_004573 [Monilinia fructicola]
MPPRIPIRSVKSLGRNFTSPNLRNASILEELRPLLRLPTLYQTTPHHRTLSSSSPLSFHTSPTLLKKKEKNKSSSSSSSSNASEESSSAVEENDPFDFSTLQAGIDKSLEKLKNDLGKLRTGGRFNPEVLEGLRVKLEKDAKESFRLGDLAQVFAEGGSEYCFDGGRERSHQAHNLHHTVCAKPPAPTTTRFPQSPRPQYSNTTPYQRIPGFGATGRVKSGRTGYYGSKECEGSYAKEVEGNGN